MQTEHSYDHRSSVYIMTVLISRYILMCDVKEGDRNLGAIPYLSMQMRVANLPEFSTSCLGEKRLLKMPIQFVLFLFDRVVSPPLPLPPFVVDTYLLTNWSTLSWRRSTSLSSSFSGSNWFFRSDWRLSAM